MRWTRKAPGSYYAGATHADGSTLTYTINRTLSEVPGCSLWIANVQFHGADHTGHSGWIGDRPTLALAKALADQHATSVAAETPC